MKRLPILLTLAVAFAASGAAHADKLIIFKNGKAMRAQTVTKDGVWLKCEFENKNFISVKAASVASIEEAAVGSSEGELRTNKVAAGSGYVPAGGQGFNPSEGHPMEMQQAPPQQEPQEDALAEEQEAIRRQGGPVGGVPTNVPKTGFRGRFNQQQASPIQGLQPLGQNQNSLNNRRQLSPREQQRRLSRFGQQPDQNQNQNQQEGNQDN